MSDHETPCRIRIYLIRVVLVQQRHVSVPTRTSIRASEIRVPNEYSWHSDYSCSKNLVFKPPVSALAANKIRVIRAIRVRIKYRDKSVWKYIR